MKTMFPSHWCVINFTDEADRLCFKSINNNKWNEVEHIKITHTVFYTFFGYVQHPFVVRMNVVFQSKDKFYIVFKLLCSQNLELTGTWPCCRFAEFVCAVFIGRYSWLFPFFHLYRTVQRKVARVQRKMARVQKKMTRVQRKMTVAAMIA